MYRDISVSRKFLLRLEDCCSSSSVGRLFLRPFSWDFRDAIWSSIDSDGMGFLVGGGDGGGDGESRTIGAGGAVGAGVVRSMVSRSGAFRWAFGGLLWSDGFLCLSV